VLDPSRFTLRAQLTPNVKAPSSPRSYECGSAALRGDAVLLLAGIWGAVVAGWTINGVFAMGEEYGWRGLMWEELEHLGVIRANLIIGTIWGLWHAPLILQGYNYPGRPVLGTLAMVLFCTGLSFILTGVRRLTGSVLPVAAAHGTFNALAPILLILAPGTDSVVTGPLGATGALVLAVIGGCLWFAVRRSEVIPAASDVDGPSVRKAWEVS
jgi:hypothetical protein